MKLLDLFSGIGLHAEGFRRAGVEIAGMCEVDPYCRAVLTKNFPGVWIHDDVRTLTTETVLGRCGRVDIIAGGFPCTDISVAGAGAGLGKGTRSGLWREQFRLVRGIRPTFVVLENVPAIRTRGYDRIADALARIGYAVAPSVVGAWAVGAPHERNRAWIVANARREGLQGREYVACFPRPAQAPHPVNGNNAFGSWFPLDPAVARVPDRDGGSVAMARRELQAVGNANPSQVPELIASWILAQEGGQNVRP